GHAALLTLELLEEAATKAGRQAISCDDIEQVREQCVFTTHTPVAAGHDQFPMDLVARVFGHREDFLNLRDMFCAQLVTRVLEHGEGHFDLQNVFSRDNTLNMTY